jgi:glycosyltransferase involved in cell wall biosynthesis
MLNYEFPPIGGGAANAHLCLLKQYAQTSDLKVDTLTSASRPGLFEEKFSDNVTVYRVGVHKRSLHFWRKSEVIEWLVKAPLHYRRLLRANDYDLVHAFFGFPTGWLCYRTADKLPYIISLRGSDVPGRHARLQLDYKILGPAFKAIWKKAAGLVACSEGLKNRALRFLPSASIDVIPNGVELDRFHPAETKPESDAVRLLTVGRLSVTKRVDMLIDAVEILCKAGRSVRFTIVGGGGLEQKLTQIVAQRNLTNVIELTGRMDSEKMPELYRRNDIFISATMQEGMSNAMLEAMASGLPIITTPCEGAEELVTDNGIVVDRADAKAMADNIMSMADDKESCDTMRLAARKQAQRFSWENTAQQYMKYYDLIRQRNP